MSREARSGRSLQVQETPSQRSVSYIAFCSVAKKALILFGGRGLNQPIVVPPPFAHNGPQPVYALRAGRAANRRAITGASRNRLLRQLKRDPFAGSLRGVVPGRRRRYLQPGYRSLYARKPWNLSPSQQLSCLFQVTLPHPPGGVKQAPIQASA